MPVLLFIVDWLFLSYLLIIAGGIGTTICLYFIGNQANPALRRNVDYLRIDLNELKRKVEDNKARTKKDISDIYKKFEKLQKKIEENER